MRIKILLFMFLIPLSEVLIGQVMSFSLMEAQEYAIENSYNVKSAAFDVEIAKKKVNETMAIGFPQIGAVIDYNYFIQQPTTLIPDFFNNPDDLIEITFGTKHNTNLGIQLDQLIFDARYLIGLQYSKLYSRLSEQNLEKSEIDIKALVAETYYSILVGDESLKVLDSTMVILEKTRYETEEMFKEGFAEETDYDQLTLTITDIENSINVISRQNEIAYDMLKFQMGIPLESEIRLSQSLEDVLKQINIEAISNQKFLMESNIDYRMIVAQEQMKVLNLRNERSSFWPAFNGYLSYTQNAQRESFTFIQGGKPWFPSASVGLSLNVPIFSSGMKRARVNQAKLELEKIRTSKEQVEQNLLLSVNRARLAFNTALENFYREQKGVELSEKIYKKSLLKYSEGVTTSAELTQQHNQFFDAESRYFQTILVLLSAKNELDRTLGNY